ncbi:zinc finger and BTB domain-containing protein 7B isoform X2 [Stigmatopora argus]
MSSGEDGLIGIPFPEHSNELLSHLNDQRRSGLFCDLTLTSGGARYPTHRSVMSAVSLYFRRLFGAEEGGCGEGSGGFSVCQLDCVAPDALDALLEFAYTATLTIPCSGMRDVLRGAQLLGIQCVADACRDILGEKAEQDEEELRNQHVAAVRRSGGENESRRKMDRKKLKKVGPHRINSLLNPPPASPVSYPSPISESLRLRTPAQPPSLESEEPLFRGWQNGSPGAVRVPERGPTLTRGHLHWMPQRPPPSAVPPEDKLSEEEDMEGFGNEGTLMESTSTTSPAAELAEGTAAAALATMATGVGRRRKSQMPQQCPVCQKIIHGAGKLPRHMRTHTGEKPFQCSACGVRFTRNDKLKIHMRKHTGERPYSCPHCTARFLHSYDLKNHLSLHSGARPFECLLCHKAFAREDHLQRHHKGHSCLELRTRRPKPEPDEQEELDVNGGGMFRAEVDMERSLALQALAQLSPQQFANYHALYLQGMEMRGGAEGESKDSGAVNAQPHSWSQVAGEKFGEVEEE